MDGGVEGWKSGVVTECGLVILLAYADGGASNRLRSTSYGGQELARQGLGGRGVLYGGCVSPRTGLARGAVGENPASLGEFWVSGVVRLLHLRSMLFYHNFGRHSVLNKS